MDEHVEGREEADRIEAEAGQAKIDVARQRAQPLFLGTLTEDHDDRMGQPTRGVGDQLGALPVHQAHGAADHRRRRGDFQLLPGFGAGEEDGKRDAVRDDLGAAVQLVQSDELRLGPLGGQDLHVHAAEHQATESPPHRTLGLRRQMGRGHDDGRADGDGRQNGVLGGM